MAFSTTTMQPRRRIPAVGQAYPATAPSVTPDAPQPVETPQRFDTPPSSPPSPLPTAQPQQSAPGAPPVTRTKRDLIPDPVAGPSAPPPTGIGRAPQMPTATPRPPLTTDTTTMAPKPGGVINEGTNLIPRPAPATAPPMPTTPLAQPSVPGATVTPFGPDTGDLRAGMITPTATARGTAAQDMADSAAKQVSGFDPVEAMYANAGRSRDFLMPADSQDGMSRSEIAQKRLEAFDAKAAPQIRDQLRSVGQLAAARGRLGMGDTAVETLQPYTDYLTQRKALETELAANTAEGEIADRNQATDRNLAIREAALGTGGNVAGMQSAANLSRLGALSGLEQNITGQEASRRNELRGERDYQQMMAQQALENAMQERQQSNSEYGQDSQLAMQMAALGYGFDPTGAYQNAAGQAGQQAGQGWQGAGDALAWYLMNRQRPQGG